MYENGSPFEGNAGSIQQLPDTTNNSTCHFKKSNTNATSAIKNHSEETNQTYIVYKKNERSRNEHLSHAES